MVSLGWLIDEFRNQTLIMMCASAVSTVVNRANINLRARARSLPFPTVISWMFETFWMESSSCVSTSSLRQTR